MWIGIPSKDVETGKEVIIQQEMVFKCKCDWSELKKYATENPPHK